MIGFLPRVWRLRVRRTLFAALVIATTGAVALMLSQMLRANGMTALELPILVLATVLIAPIVLSFWMAAIGFVVERVGGDPLALDVAAVDRLTGPLRERTAVVVAIYNEDPWRVLAGVEASYRSLEETGHLASFDFFVLSDTMDPDRWIEEEQAVAALRARLSDPDRVRYRNRVRNVDKKVGNIADFCRRWGDRYLSMVVFDADSVMSGRTLVRLARWMSLHPEIGIIQAPPVPVNRRTLFGRLQQFAARAYGPTWATGLAWLQDGEGNYYGHNAILRIAPFVEHCRLPVLPGKEPLGGAILSHDFVEAALIRKAGYRVHLAVGLDGSYEEPPPTLIDYAVRDRRWCQGNLQHARLLGMQGLHAMSRTHLLLGVTSYAAAPLWLALLLLWTAEALRVELTPHAYFAPEGSLFPIWEVSVAAQATLLLGLVVLLLFVPRMLALASRLCDRREREAFGGARSLIASFASECFLSMLLSPVLMIEQSRFVLGILLGKSVGWGSQPRSDRGIELDEALRRHGGVTVLGIGWTVLLLLLAPGFLGWMAPVLVGMVLSVPLSIASSRVTAGRWARARGLLTTPEETAPEPVLLFLHAAIARLGEREQPPAGSALERVLRDPALLATHLGFAEDDGPEDPLTQHELRGLILKCRLKGAAALSPADQRALLRSPRALRALAEHRARRPGRGSAAPSLAAAGEARVSPRPGPAPARAGLDPRARGPA